MYVHEAGAEAGVSRRDLRAAPGGGLAGGEGRGRRSAPEDGGPQGDQEQADKLAVDVTKLNDTKHNEAIVHWSGQKNNVS